MTQIYKIDCNLFMGVNFIQSNVRPLIYPTIGECFICNRNSLLLAHDTTIDKSLCLDCLDDAVIVDILLQNHYGSEVHHRDEQ